MEDVIGQKRPRDEANSTESFSGKEPVNKGRLLDQDLTDPTSLIKDLVEKQILPLAKEITKLQNMNGALRVDVSMLIEEVDKLYRINAQLRDDLEEQNQYSRRWNVRFFGLEEVAGEDAESLEGEIIKKCKDFLQVELENWQIGVCHRLGRPIPNKHRPVICQFVCQKTMREVIEAAKENRETTKAKKLFISEDLTSTRAELLKDARALAKTDVILGAWSDKGVVKVRKNDRKIQRVRYHHDIQNLVREHHERGDAGNSQRPGKMPREKVDHNRDQGNRRESGESKDQNRDVPPEMQQRVENPPNPSGTPKDQGISQPVRRSGIPPLLQPPKFPYPPPLPPPGGFHQGPPPRPEIQLPKEATPSAWSKPLRHSTPAQGNAQAQAQSKPLSRTPLPIDLSQYPIPATPGVPTLNLEPNDHTFSHNSSISVNMDVGLDPGCVDSNGKDGPEEHGRMIKRDKRGTNMIGREMDGVTIN